MISIRNIFKPNAPKNKALRDSISKTLGYTPKNLLYYTKAFTHGSINQKDASGNSISYERLEFVGDALLSAVIAHYLFEKVKDADEGYLTKTRSKIVSRDHLNAIGKELGSNLKAHPILQLQPPIALKLLLVMPNNLPLSPKMKPQRQLRHQIKHRTHNKRRI